jgi:hypothetical protein
MKSINSLSSGLKVGLIAILINIITVVVYIYQTNIMQSQKQASVWPYVEWSSSYIQGKGFNLSVSNNGIGPALIKDISIFVDGKKQENLDSLLSQLIDTTYFPHIKGNLEKRVIPAGKKIILLQSSDYKWSELLYVSFQKKNFKMEIRYESIYQDKWISNGTEVTEGWTK